MSFTVKTLVLYVLIGIPLTLMLSVLVAGAVGAETGDTDEFLKQTEGAGICVENQAPDDAEREFVFIDSLGHGHHLYHNSTVLKSDGTEYRIDQIEDREEYSIVHYANDEYINASVIHEDVYYHSFHGLDTRINPALTYEIAKDCTDRDTVVLAFLEDTEINAKLAYAAEGYKQFDGMNDLLYLPFFTYGTLTFSDPW